MQKYFYARVSTKEQILDRQLKSAKEHNIPEERIYADKISGKNTNRPEWKKLNEVMTSGDILIVTSMSRISRSLKDVIEIIKDLQDREISIKMLKENIDTTTATGRMMAGVLGSVYEFEREMIVDRVKEGVNISLEKRKSESILNESGHVWGGNKVKELTSNQKKNLTLWIEKKIKTSEAMKLLDVKSRASLYNLKAKMS